MIRCVKSIHFLTEIALHHSLYQLSSRTNQNGTLGEKAQAFHNIADRNNYLLSQVTVFDWVKVMPKGFDTQIHYTDIKITFITYFKYKVSSESRNKKKKRVSLDKFQT